MSRVLERHDNYWPVLEAVLADPPDEALLNRFHGCELINCIDTCTKGLIVKGPVDDALILELDKEGWPMINGLHYCPAHADAAINGEPLQ